MDSPLDQVDLDRVLNQIDQLAQIGRHENGGVTRLAFSREDFLARKLLIKWMEEAGLAVRRDTVGNVIGNLRGAPPTAPIIAAGSHIDTVINAGNFDGVLGTLAAIECARVIYERTRKDLKVEDPERSEQEYAKSRSTLQVICFVMEESAHFGASYGLGSRVMLGAPISDDELQMRDANGLSLARAVQELNAWEEDTTFDSSEEEALARTRRGIEQSRSDFSRYRAYVELHIEQGPVLEKADKRIGIVTAVAAPTRFKMAFLGEQNHSGTTPMSSRHDALTAAADAILTIERIARGHAQEGIVGTVGTIRVFPGAMNVIPGRAEIGVDIRGIDAKAKGATVAEILHTVEDIGRNRVVTLQVQPLSDEQPILFAEEIVQVISDVCSEMGIDAIKLPSGAGHDAAHLAEVIDAGMIFVPSRGGISHDAREFTAPEDIRLGTQVLLATLLRLLEMSQ